MSHYNLMIKNKLLWLSLSGLLLSGCNNDNTNDQVKDSSTSCTPEYLSKSFSDTRYQVLSTHYFEKGELLKLSGNTTSTLSASNNVCVAKILVGPETNPQDKGQPSYSEGIGVEVWLPDQTNWNKRIHVKGGGGWAGGNHRNKDVLVSINVGSMGSAADTAMVEGAVSATTDTGHSITNGSFAMNADGSVNTELWKDFAERGIHEMAVVSKKLTRQYYGEDAKYSYWNGYSTGGRQGLKEAQVNPQDFDGILAGAPAINWTRFITAELYPQVVMQRDLNGKLITNEQLTRVSNQANTSCGLINGQAYGYLIDPSSCTYDPTKDTSILCESNPSESCLTLIQAQAINKIWYGQTEDGSVPDPALDNGFNLNLSAKQNWFGLTRGTNLSSLAGTTPFSTSSDLVALIANDSRIAQENFINKISNGMNEWKLLSYSDLNQVQQKGLALQEQFSNINTDQTDLSEFNQDGRKLIIYHGLSDVLIMPQGTLRYISQLNEKMGETNVSSFMKAYFIPGMGHSFSNGTSNINANVALPSNQDLYQALTDWVEKGIQPSTLTAYSETKDRSLPICVHPQKIRYNSGNINSANSYSCI